MKNIKFLLSAAFSLLAAATMAQDFSSPQFAKWGDTPEERERNILNSNFLKESCDNRDYNAAAHYLKELIDHCPAVQESIYQRGAIVYKNKINRARSLEEKAVYVDSLLLMYDLRAKYFGDHPKRGTAYILDQKAREVLTYKPSDRAAIREAFRAAIEAGGDNTDPETLVAYFSNLCEDYKNTDEVMPDELISEYERLDAIFEKHPEAAEYRQQVDTFFGLSGAASCENLEKLFKAKLEAAPDDEALLAQAVGLMSRENCDSDFYLAISEKYYAMSPSSNTALMLAQAFQNKDDYAKASEAQKNAAVKVAAPALLEDTGMYKVSIICKLNKFDQLKRALNQLGVTGMTMTQVMGCGIQKGSGELYRGAVVDATLLPKIKVEVIVGQIPVEKVIEAAKKALYTGHIGDGKIFVYQVAQVVKVRTGEENLAALADVE